MDVLRKLLTLPWAARSRWEGERAETMTRRKVPGVVTLSLSTLVPSKWLIVDRETGDLWEWRDDPNNLRVGWYRPELLEVTHEQSQ